MILIVLLFYSIEGSITRSCTHSRHCRSPLTCPPCAAGQSCQIKFINRRVERTCVQRRPESKKSKEASEYYCPGGGAVVVGFDGKLSTCDLTNQCRSTHICNPLYGVCCTKIRTCPRPTKVILNALTNKPILCQVKSGQVMPCPSGGYCETKTGFCCTTKGVLEITNPPVQTRPWLGQKCNIRDGCDGGAACMCDNKYKCTCECPTELGYVIDPNARTCKRVRRRLKEKCKTDMECSAAFSECSTGGCRCKKGFKRDGRGGCRPISYNCVNSGKPLMVLDEVVTCSMKSALAMLLYNTLKHGPPEVPKIQALNETADWPQTFGDDCPDDYYCVPVFDDATKPGHYQGFCCPSPGQTRPVCPVGEPHETSSPPNYGCDDCPIEYYCHRDIFYPEKSICCPKPCISLEDTYYDGQCYPTAFYGDSCHISAQCSPSRNSTDEFSLNSPLECVKGVCTCRAGFSHIDGECKRVMCTVGLRGEPSVDRNNQLIRCGRSSDCSQGQMCDPNTRVCCKGNNKCPKNYVETGATCENGGCERPGDLCYRPKSGKIKICCTVDGP